MTFFPVLRIRSIFFGSGSSDPVFKIRIRVRVTPKRPNPTGSGSFLDMFFMFSKINNFFMAFSYQIYGMTIKVQDNKLF